MFLILVLNPLCPISLYIQKDIYATIASYIQGVIISSIFLCQMKYLHLILTSYILLYVHIIFSCKLKPLLILISVKGQINKGQIIR